MQKGYAWQMEEVGKPIVRKEFDLPSPLSAEVLVEVSGCAVCQVRINSTCNVFAGTELRDRLALGEEREDILAGLHRAIILRAMSLLSRSGEISDQFTFTGGVANNEAAVMAL